MGTWSPPPLPAWLAASRQVPLVGRRSELATFESVWCEVAARRRQVVFLGGEPGGGKTRLTAEVASTLADLDVTVLAGASDPDAGVPYGPFAEMLDHLFASAEPGSLAPAVGGAGTELARLSRRVAQHQSEDRPGPSDGGEARHELFEAVASFFRNLAVARPLVLALDDLHWAQLPTLALLDHVVRACPEVPLLVVAAFRTTTPDRSDDLVARIADLHRLEGVRRLDLAGLDTEAIAEYLALRTGLKLSEARAPAALLRDRTGGNPFFLRELWTDLQARGGLAALRSSLPVPASVGDTLAARLTRLPEETRSLIELAAVLGDRFELATLVAASEQDPRDTIAMLDTAVAARLIVGTGTGTRSAGTGVDAAGVGAGDVYAFAHALARQAVVDRMPPSRRTLLHARAAQALEARPRLDALVPQLAHHYLACHVLGYHEKAFSYCQAAASLAERSLAFEEAAGWFERAAQLPECEPTARAQLLLAGAADHVRAGDFPRARGIYEPLARTGDPAVRLAAAIGYEDATWRPGVVGPLAADLLSAALEASGLAEHDPLVVRGVASLARALAIAGDMARARALSARALELARLLGDETALVNARVTSMWHGTTPAEAPAQLERTVQLRRLAAERHDDEILGAAANFGATVGYVLGRPDVLHQSIDDAERADRVTGLPYYHYMRCCLAQAEAFLHGDFAQARRWADETRERNDALGDDMAEGPYGVQRFMIERETGGLEAFRRFLDGEESFAGRWVPGLLALYAELRIENGVRRALEHLLGQVHPGRVEEAQWPMELVFLTEGALLLGEPQALHLLSSHLERYSGMNLAAGTLIAVFGSTERYLARAAAALGDPELAERSFLAAQEMDRRMLSTVHLAESLAEHARFVAGRGELDRGRQLAAEPIGQRRVLRLVDKLAPAPRPDGLTEHEIEVLRLLAAGLSNHAIGERLFISANTAANHVRSILVKTGAANRTQAAMYAAQRQLV